ncbi:hypothetical protein M3226_01000 [Neobacillus cucumis]|uniref:hypothetical protein n=1 Tax=Neobacillus cucumis TaxID=1740721 RepID=UPI0020425C1D|nr:hypothetical protein [Neobacillus cucumis]MCM3724279.1 hypothetical protein [Neobacillus cucumis]
MQRSSNYALMQSATHHYLFLIDHDTISTHAAMEDTTIMLYSEYSISNISILASIKDATSNIRLLLRHKGYFNPRILVGCDREVGNLPIVVRVSIHAPILSTTNYACEINNACLVSIHALMQSATPSCY